jgi:signal transduction histidine kinase
MQSQLDAGAGTLIRTPEGRITFWSEELQRRYGFSADDALGQDSSELLRARHWQTRDQIDAVLATRSEWRGGVIVCRADDQPMMVANHWHLHRGGDGQESFVTEVHTDIITPGTDVSDEMADIAATLAGELSQPLTALAGFIDSTQLAVESERPERGLLGRLSKAAAQLDRASGMVTRIRTLGEMLRNQRLRELHAKLANVAAQSERLNREAKDAQAASITVGEQSASARQRSQEAREEWHTVERAFIQQSIQVYRRRLASLRLEARDTQAEHLLTQLLEEEEARLASLDQKPAEKG